MNVYSVPAQAQAQPTYPQPANAQPVVQAQPAYPQPTNVQPTYPQPGGVAVQIAYPQTYNQRPAVTSLDSDAKSFKKHRISLCISLILDIFVGYGISITPLILVILGFVFLCTMKQGLLYTYCVHRYISTVILCIYLFGGQLTDLGIIFFIINVILTVYVTYVCYLSGPVYKKYSAEQLCSLH